MLGISNSGLKHSKKSFLSSLTEQLTTLHSHKLWSFEDSCLMVPKLQECGALLWTCNAVAAVWTASRRLEVADSAKVVGGNTTVVGKLYVVGRC